MQNAKRDAPSARKSRMETFKTLPVTAQCSARIKGARLSHPHPHGNPQKRVMPTGVSDDKELPSVESSHSKPFDSSNKATKMYPFLRANSD